jgi:hypothetical protein
VALNKAVKKKHYFGRKVQVFMCSGHICTVLHRKWWCEVGGIMWWPGNSDFKRTEGKYVVRNDKVMWPGDLGEISVSLRLSKYVELQLCSSKQSVSPVVQ